MGQQRAHEPEKLTRYAFGDLSEKEREKLERHLRTCGPCQEFVSFVRDFNAGLHEARPKEPLPGEPCPDRSLLIDLEEGELDDKTAEHVRAHMLFCRDCRGEFEALARLRPKVIQVGLRAARALFELFRPPEVGAWQSLPATVTVMGKRVPVAPFEVAEMLRDPERNKSKVALRLEEGLEADHVSVFVQSDEVLPEWKWRISLVDGEEQEWVSMPFDKPEVQVTSGVPYGFYALEVYKGEDCFGTFKFTVEPFSADEALEKAREYVASGDYLRAVAILEDAHRRDPENNRLLEELNRARELVAEEEAEEEEEEDEEERD